MSPQFESPCQHLSSEERSRLHELERTVERTLESFLECGRALLEVRDRALYREHYKSFEHYLTRRFSISYSQGASLMRSTLVAEHLLAGPAGQEGDAPAAPRPGRRHLASAPKVGSDAAMCHLAARQPDPGKAHPPHCFGPSSERSLQQSSKANQMALHRRVKPTTHKRKSFCPRSIGWRRVIASVHRSLFCASATRKGPSVARRTAEF